MDAIELAMLAKKYKEALNEHGTGYLKDVELIKKIKPILGFLFTDQLIYDLWEQFSDDYCVSWLMVSESWVESFSDWLLVKAE